MIILFGSFLVILCVLGGFMMSGGNVYSLLHISELIVIGGAALGALIIMSPKKVLMDMLYRITQALKGAPYSRKAYEDLLMALYELFLLGRRSGMIPLEAHLSDPNSSSIFGKYPSFIKNAPAVQFLCGALRPIVDGRIKAEQLRVLLDAELEGLEAEHYAPVNVMTKTADAMPGFGIVAAVLGIVVTMSAISGPVEEIGQKVAAALVGTFLGVLMSYGFLNPLAVNMEFNATAEIAYLQCIAVAVNGFASGMAPIMAIELARRGLSTDLRPSAEELEAMLKPLNAQVKTA